jgi:hypothetical protein
MLFFQAKVNLSMHLSSYLFHIRLPSQICIGMQGNPSCLAYQNFISLLISFSLMIVSYFSFAEETLIPEDPTDRPLLGWLRI